MHVQSKVTRFMSDYDFSVVGVPSAELTRLRIEGLNHEDNVAGCCSQKSSDRRRLRSSLKIVATGMVSFFFSV